jgi:tetratricopeptide (TPR) repeat protein
MEAYRQMYTTPDSQAESIYHVLRSVLDHGQFLEYRLAEAQDALRRASSGPPLEPHARDLIGLLPGISDVGLIRQYGLLCMEAGGFDEAAAYLMKAHKLLPDDENVAIALARALAPLGVEQMTQASEVLVEVLQKNYQSWRAHLELGLMIGGINPTSAVEHGRIAANLAPKEPADQYLRAQIGYARILETAKRCAQAIEQYQYVLSIAPDVPLRTRLIEWRISELKQKMRRG